MKRQYQLLVLLLQVLWARIKLKKAEIRFELFKLKVLFRAFKNQIEEFKKPFPKQGSMAYFYNVIMYEEDRKEFEQDGGDHEIRFGVDRASDIDSGTFVSTGAIDGSGKLHHVAITHINDAPTVAELAKRWGEWNDGLGSGDRPDAPECSD